MPFVIKYPKEIPAGKRIDDIILNIDFPSFYWIMQLFTTGFISRKEFRKNLS